MNHSLYTRFFCVFALYRFFYSSKETGLSILLFSAVSPLIPLGAVFTATIKPFFTASLTSPFWELFRVGEQCKCLFKEKITSCYLNWTLYCSVQLSASPAFLELLQCWQENMPKPVSYRGTFERQLQLTHLGFGGQNLYGLLIRGEFTHLVMLPLWWCCGWAGRQWWWRSRGWPLLCCLHSTTRGLCAGALGACSNAASRVLGCHTQSDGILPPLLFLFVFRYAFTFTSPYKCYSLSTQTHTDIPFFHLFRSHCV